MFRENLKIVLLDGTSLILQKIRGEISIRQFIVDYDNFYYQAALDGHEANFEEANILFEFSEFIELHRYVQEQVVDLVFYDQDYPGLYYAEGRIDLHEANERISSLNSEYDIENLIAKLK